ncbi:MAG: hypothetical protein FWD57_02170 [Polyangiaceae bacterium]|nr:hypothetical protein [Polyangiaceae bacterium]
MGRCQYRGKQSEPSNKPKDTPREKIGIRVGADFVMVAPTLDWGYAAGLGYGGLVTLSANWESWVDLTFRSGYISHSTQTSYGEYGETESPNDEIPFLFGLRLIASDWFYFRSEVGPVMMPGRTDNQAGGSSTFLWMTLEAGFYRMAGVFDLGVSVLGRAGAKSNEEKGKGYMLNLGFSFGL